MAKIKCKVCGKIFIANRTTRKICGVSCSNEIQRKRYVKKVIIKTK